MSPPVARVYFFFHQMGGAECQHPARRDRHLVTGFRVAAHTCRFGSHGERPEGDQEEIRGADQLLFQTTNRDQKQDQKQTMLKLFE